MPHRNALFSSILEENIIILRDCQEEAHRARGRMRGEKICGMLEILC